MTYDQLIEVLARLDVGFRKDSAALKDLEYDLAATVKEARHFAKKHGAPEGSDTRWHEHWDQVQQILRHIHAFVNEMDRCYHSDETDRVEKAISAWESIQAEDAKLFITLSAIRTEAQSLNSAIRAEWNVLARALDAHFETAHACADALRIKLELLKKHTNADIRQLVDDFLTKLPNRNFTEEMNLAAYLLEYQKADAAITADRHTFTGIMDIVRGLLMRMETPQVRMRKSHSLKIEET